MKIRRSHPARVLFALCALLLWCAPPAFAEKPDQLKPQGYVNDFAGALNAQSNARITAIAAELDQKTQAQLAIVTIRSLEGRSPEDFANRLFERWGVGHKGDDRGVLILFAIEDRKYWTEVGYGLEPILPDGKVGGFGREMVPMLRQTDYGGAALHMTERIAQVIAQDRGVTLASIDGGRSPGSRRQSRDQSPQDSGDIVLLLIVLAFFGIPLGMFLLKMFGSKRRPGQPWDWGDFFGGGVGGGDSWGGGGGFDGGGFGGFGGGGSGGGGAGGGW